MKQQIYYMSYESLGKFVGITVIPVLEQSTKTVLFVVPQLQIDGQDDTLLVDTKMISRTSKV